MNRIELAAIVARGERRLKERPEGIAWTELERATVECTLRGEEIGLLKAESSALRIERDALRQTVQLCFGSEPCPKCGYGVDSCYGCKLVERDADIARLRAENRALHIQLARLQAKETANEAQ